MKRALMLTVSLLLPMAAQADVVVLRGGGELRGVIVEQRADAVVIEVGPGLVTVPMARVTRITGGGNELAEYRARAARLSPADAAGWTALAEWAEERGLHTQAREGFELALMSDPANARAHRGLGHEQLGGQWLSSEDAYRARGYESFEGRWVRPEERAALLQERANDAGRRAELAESEARVREAEARARVAEADARRAEADADAQVQGGIPYPVAYGSGGAFLPWTPGGGVRGHRDRQPAAPPVVVVPPPPPQRDQGAGRSSERGQKAGLH